MKLHEIHDFCGFSGPARPGPPPRPRAVGEHTPKLKFPSAPLTGARAGIRPRADGNPAPSRRKSGPEPTEILPRPRSPPPFKYLPYSLPVRVGRCASPPHSNMLRFFALAFCLREKVMWTTLPGDFYPMMAKPLLQTPECGTQETTSPIDP